MWNSSTVTFCNVTHPSDIDECSGATHGCVHLCNNTEGSYFCSCNLGYELNGDLGLCNGELKCNVYLHVCIHNAS